MKSFLIVLFAAIVALLVSDAQAGCQQQVLALRQVQLQSHYAPVQLELQQVYGVPQQLNDGCYVQQQVQLKAVKIQQQRHNDQPQLIILKQERQPQQQVIIQREALFPNLRLRGR